MSSPTRQELPRYMAMQPLFRSLNEEDLARITAQGCSLLRLCRGQTLFGAGEACEHFHVVITGQLKLFALAPNGSEKVLELLGPGQTVGEASIFDNLPQAFGAQALGDTLLLRIPKIAITDQITRDPSFALRLLADASQRIHKLQRDVESYCLHSGLQRVVDFLLESRTATPRLTQQPHTVSLPASKATIASRLNLSPEYFSRVLRELEDEGLIQISRRDIHILQPRELASYTLQ
ncbi:Crp/Fnr family transcriptional regulator [Roseateles koreensis]|uniref:Crp/Fnr family transcriptional regulator n=1 Tax=Roseateles koreensis TaxID=2987526 RepID=A0ABT5KU41_9BURK|nr:Crp/Fnr family transcriptional regulator [Roseateles koreensis]MDC8786434.1 Crp/Fnr family transcriptional regulator [Roseateles koreensis]